MSFFKNLVKGTLGVVAAPFTGGASLGLTADAVLGAGTQLIGGVMGQRAERKAIDAQNEYNSPAAIRARAEGAGFNPLSFIGPGVGNQTATGGSNYMGAAIADAGLMLADSMSRKKESQQVSALQAQNQKLQDHIQSLTLRPKVGGIYAQRQATPTVGQALGVSDGSALKASELVSKNSPFAADLVGPAGDDLTGSQLAVKQDVPAFRMFGHDFYGSGLFSTGQQLEDAVGELGALAFAPLLLGDAALNESYKFGGYLRDKQTAKQKAALKAAGQPVYSIGGKTYAQQPPKTAAENRGFWNNFWGAYGQAY